MPFAKGNTIGKDTRFKIGQSGTLGSRDAGGSGRAAADSAAWVDRGSTFDAAWLRANGG